MRPEDRLQPSLLDRLTDEEPDKKREVRDRRVLSLRQLREAIQRDLTWLLNTTNLGSVRDLTAYPEVARSVLNFGIPDLTGRSVAGLRADQIQALLRQSILDFEPRILKDSLKVHVDVSREEMTHNALRFYIEGDLWAEPVPLPMLLESEIDLETGHVELHEARKAGR